MEEKDKFKVKDAKASIKCDTGKHCDVIKDTDKQMITSLEEVFNTTHSHKNGGRG